MEAFLKKLTSMHLSDFTAGFHQLVDIDQSRWGYILIYGLCFCSQSPIWRLFMIWKTSLLVIMMIFAFRDVSGQVAFEEEMPKVNRNNRFLSKNAIANLTWLKLPRYLMKIIFCSFSKVVLWQLFLCVKSILKPWNLLVYSFNFLRTTIWGSQ